MNKQMIRSLPGWVAVLLLLGNGMTLAQEPNGNTGISGGPEHMCALTSSGGAKCWGSNVFGQLGSGDYTNHSTPNLVVNLANASALSVRWIHGCALLTTGRIKCWGHNGSGQLGVGNNTGIFISNSPLDVIGITQATQVVTGNDHTCALIADGTVRCWGDNTRGQLGIGNFTASGEPQMVPGLIGVVSVAVGKHYTCAVLDTGAVRCWGANGYGQLGTGNLTPTNVPANVLNVTNAASVTIGTEHTCVRLTDGAAQCWGYNWFGQLGDSSKTNASTPVPVTGLTGSLALVAGGTHTCARMPGATMKCWGGNSSGQLGDGTSIDRTVPVNTMLADVESIGAGNEATCARLQSGELRCFGNNRSGQLGNGIAGNNPNPGFVSNIIDVTAIDLEMLHTCAVVVGGAVRCWGDNTNGQLGDGTTTHRLMPQNVNNLTNMTAVAVGLYHSCALSASRQVFCWGNNSWGQLGNGNYSYQTNPVAVQGINNAVMLTVGHVSSCALLDTQQVKCWGSSNNAELGNGSSGTTSNVPVTVSNLTDITAIGSGSWHHCARHATGTVSCWGRNTEFQIGDRTSVNRTTPVPVFNLGNVVSLALGHYSSCALLGDGSVRCWGANYDGQLGNGGTSGSGQPVVVSGITGATSLSAGISHVCVEQPGAIRCWGWNSAGQLGNGNLVNSNVPVLVQPIESVSKVVAGGLHTCAIVANGAMNGAMKCWGLNRDGQLGNGVRGYEMLPQPVVGSPLVTYSLAYSAAANGSISGVSAQTVNPGGNGTAVTAVPASGYHFVQWSDGSTANPRSDQSVQANLAVTATFANSAPMITAVASSPSVVYEEESATITVTAQDLESGGLGYQFDCNNDGTYEVGPQAAASAQCLLPQPGQATVGVRVSDAPGAASTSSLVVDVLNSIPQVALNPANTPLEDAAIALNATATVPSTGESIAFVRVDCDYDGTTFSIDLEATSANGLGCPGFSSPGIRVIGLLAIDDEGETSALATRAVDVQGVNDAPSFMVGSLVEHPAGSTGAQTVFNFSVFDAGPPDERATQTVSAYLIDSLDDPAGVLVPGSVGISTTGDLSHTLTGVGGSATVTARVRDSGGTTNGGVDLSASQQFVISVPRSADLQVAVDNERGQLLDGEATVYAVVIANAGPNAVTGARLTGTPSNNLVGVTWMCRQQNSTATCPTPDAGSGGPDLLVDLGVNQYLRFDVMAIADGDVGAFVSLTATAVAPAGFVSINSSNDIATDQDAIVPIGVFANGFESAGQAVTVTGALRALRAE